jgi:YesN/AraC family two-component response regulator
MSDQSPLDSPAPVLDRPVNPETLRPFHYLDSIRKDSCRISFSERFDEKSKIWNFTRHSHQCIELIYFLEGKAEISEQDRTMALSLFELVVYPHGVYHQEYLDTRYHQAIICLHLECEAALTYDHLFKLKDDQGVLRWLIKRIHDEYHHPDPFQPEILSDLTSLLLGLMKRIAFEYQTPNVNIPEKCMQFIQEHFAEKIDMNTLAAEIHVSPSYLNRVFKRRFDITPIHYLNLFRIEVAREILVQTTNKIATIASLVGFDDPKHFAKLFKKTTGMTPATYRDSFASKQAGT